MPCSFTMRMTLRECWKFFPCSPIMIYLISPSGQRRYRQTPTGCKRRYPQRTFNYPFSGASSSQSRQCFRQRRYFKGEGTEALLKVPIYEEELKYFYSNYHDYYYLPTEDVALHKSVAGFVDKAHRVNATAATCYTRNLLPISLSGMSCLSPSSKGITEAKSFSLSWPTN